MKQYNVFVTVTPSYKGTFTATSKEQAIEKAREAMSVGALEECFDCNLDFDIYEG
jgi:hypothetical protein